MPSKVLDRLSFPSAPSNLVSICWYITFWFHPLESLLHLWCLPTAHSSSFNSFLAMLPFASTLTILSTLPELYFFTSLSLSLSCCITDPRVRVELIYMLITVLNLAFLDWLLEFISCKLLNSFLSHQTVNPFHTTINCLKCSDVWGGNIFLPSCDPVLTFFLLGHDLIPNLPSSTLQVRISNIEFLYHIYSAMNINPGSGRIVAMVTSVQYHILLQ